jgi:hypothetical protein
MESVILQDRFAACFFQATHPAIIMDRVAKMYHECRLNFVRWTRGDIKAAIGRIQSTITQKNGERRGCMRVLLSMYAAQGFSGRYVSVCQTLIDPDLMEVA